MSNKTFILTGGSSGIGYYCSRAIATTQLNSYVVIASRDKFKGKKSVTTLKHQTGNKHIVWMHLDLASLKSIRTFVKDFSSRKFPPLHSIACIAGIGASKTSYTKDGFEMSFGVNCLGNFLLVNLLLRYLVAPARIVFVSSDTHDPQKREKTFLDRFMDIPTPQYHDAKALAFPQQYSNTEKPNESPKTIARLRYSTSKLCEIYYTYEFSRRLQTEGYSTAKNPITVNAFTPKATPGTDIMRDAGIIANFVWRKVLPKLRFIMPQLQSLDGSGKALAHLLVDPNLEKVSGKYFKEVIKIRSSKESYSKRKAAELWETSAELVKLQLNETLLKRIFIK